MRARAAWTFAAIAALAVPLTASAGPWQLAPGEYYSQLEGSRDVSDTQYDADGHRGSLDQGYVVERRALTSVNQFGWTKWGSLTLSAPARSATRRSAQLGVEATDTGFGDIEVGLGIPIVRGRTAVAIEGLYTAPLGYQTVTAPTLGLGKQNVTGDVAIGTGFPGLQTFVQADAGYRWWPNRYASQYVGGAEAGVWLGSAVLLLGHYHGAIAQTQSGKASFSNHIVGPELRVRVDDRFDMIAGSNHTAAGKSIDHIDEYYVGVAYRQTRLDRLQGILGSKRRP